MSVQSNRTAVEFSASQFADLTLLLRELSGIELSASKLKTIQTRLQPRLQELDLKNFNEYIAFLEHDKGASEREIVYDLLTTNYTSFYREPHHFEYLKDAIVARPDPHILVDIWSAGCATGQEPYTISMELAALCKSHRSLNFQILATDISREALDATRTASYSQSALKEIPSDRRQFIVKNGANFTFDRHVLRPVAVKQLNLFSDWNFQRRFDFIFCRNVMIYFAPKERENLIARFANYLKPGGLLFIGHSESMLAGTPRLEPFGTTTLRKKS